MTTENTCLRRSHYLALSLVAVLLAQGFAVSGVAASESRTPPNILIMVSDDQRWDALGLVQREQGANARFPFLQTPNLDALAAQGMRFRNAFVTTSLCSPSRSAILTGQYNHTNGIVDNKTPFSPRPTWASALQAEGYTTAMIGKWHHGNQRERPGFDVVNSFVGQGKYYDTSFIVDGKAVHTEGYIDKVTVDFALKFLEERGKQPFAMLVGFKAVHQPFTPMEENLQDYADDTIRPSPNVLFPAPWLQGTALMPDLPRPGRIRFWKDYFRTLKGLDANVGRLLDALDRLHLANNTLVIFTSDNGYYLGEHKLGDKRSAYEESMRVPMLVRLPGIVEPGTVSDEMVLNIDIAPTILDLVTDGVPAAMQGQSLLPLFGHGPTAWRKAFFYEYWRNQEGGKGTTSAATPTILAVRTATHKLITYPHHNHWMELFDLTKDPYEIRNLARFAGFQQTQTEMCRLLQRLLVETGYMLAKAPLLAARPPMKQTDC